MQKKYILDTNVLLNDPDCILTLYNGSENEIYVPKHVLLELDLLKTDVKKRHLALNAINSLIENKDIINFLDTHYISSKFKDRVDSFILDEIKLHKLDTGILITNDKLLQLESSLKNIESQEYKEINPFKSESEKYNGFDENNTPNSFKWVDGKVLFNNEKLIDYNHDAWKIKPKNVYQNLAMELILNNKIDIVSIQSVAGLGKTTIALACAFELVFFHKLFKKIYVLKPNVELGQSLGFLPGNIEDKLAPYYNYLDDIINKLHNLRPCNKLFNEDNKTYNKSVFEILPINFIRGRNIEHSVVIVDEMQNLTRMESRAILSRMGENVKCICIGDTSQVDHMYLNNDNNGLNWLVKLFKGNTNYGHITLKGDKSRGPICDLVLKSGL